MRPIHFVRVGVLGHVGRFVGIDQTIHPRGRRVICRTRRGTEVGEVLSSSVSENRYESADGSLLRAVTVEDDLVLTRMDKNRDAAYHACVGLLSERNINATLMDVEHLFDGEALFFYFLGEVTPQIEEITQSLAATYEAKVQFRQFADAVERGCGADCGTDSAEGCGTGCSNCAIADACKSNDGSSTEAN